MNSSKRSLYSILSFLPLLFFLAYMIMGVSFFMDMISHADDLDNDHHPEEFIFSNIGPLLITGILFGLTTIAVMIIFIIHAIGNKSLPDGERIAWILIFIFLGIIGFPIYWFMRGIKYDENNYAVNRSAT